MLCLWSLFQLFSQLWTDPLSLLLDCTCPQPPPDENSILTWRRVPTSACLPDTSRFLTKSFFGTIRNQIPTFEQWQGSCGWPQRKWYLKNLFLYVPQIERAPPGHNHSLMGLEGSVCELESAMPGIVKKYLLPSSWC